MAGRALTPRPQAFLSVLPPHALAPTRHVGATYPRLRAANAFRSLPHPSTPHNDELMPRKRLNCWRERAFFAWFRTVAPGTDAPLVFRLRLERGHTTQCASGVAKWQLDGHAMRKPRRYPSAGGTLYAVAANSMVACMANALVAGFSAPCV